MKPTHKNLYKRKQAFVTQNLLRYSPWDNFHTGQLAPDSHFMVFQVNYCLGRATVWRTAYWYTLMTKSVLALLCNVVDCHYKYAAKLLIITSSGVSFVKSFWSVYVQNYICLLPSIEISYFWSPLMLFLPVQVSSRLLHCLDLLNKNMMFYWIS